MVVVGLMLTLEAATDGVSVKHVAKTVFAVTVAFDVAVTDGSSMVAVVAIGV